MNNEKIKISILVPVYNSEENLETCLNSLMDQTIKDIEIIVINDGSTDNSLKIAQKFAEKDSRFVIIDKKNSGYGDSLNFGIRKARGQYLGIVESDDYASTNMYEVLYKNTKNGTIDIVKSKHSINIQNADNEETFGETGTNARSYNSLPKYQAFTAKENPNIFYLMPSVWSAIYKKDFILSNDLFFVNTPRASFQDRSFAFKIYTKANSILIVDEILYHYCPGEANSSITQTSIMTNFLQQMEIFTFLMRNKIVDVYMEEYLTVSMQDINFDLSRLDKSQHNDLLCVYSSWYKHLDFYNQIPFKSLKTEMRNELRKIIARETPKLSNI